MIIDDEPIARDILQNYLQKVSQLELVKSCRNATEAYEALYGESVDLLFLDIQMPSITGTAFLRSLRNPPLVIFTTAHANYAVEGFELNSVDFLLKPITLERFSLAIQKVIELISLKRQALMVSDDVLDYLFIKQDTRLVRVEYSSIRYIRAERDFCSVYLRDKKLLASMHLKLFEQQLPPKQFVRVHRSYIVNLKMIRAIKGNMIELEDTEVPIGAGYREQLFQKLHLQS